MPKVPYTCFNTNGPSVPGVTDKNYLSGKAVCTETTVTTVIYAEKDCNGNPIVPPKGVTSSYPRGACTKVQDQSFGPGDWFVLATCPNYPPSEPPTPTTYDCPTDFPFKFGTGCPIGSWNSKAGKGCYKQQSQVKGCSGAAGSWCVFSAYKDDTTTMYGGSLKDQLAQGFGTVCPSETTAVTPKCGPNEQIPCFDNGADLSVFKTSDCSGKS